MAFSETLEPGESRQYNEAGNWVRIDAGDSIKIVTGAGRAAEMKTGETIEFPDFSTITITSMADTAQLVELRVLGGQLLSDGSQPEMRISQAANGVNVLNASDIGNAITVETGNIVVDNVKVNNRVALAREQLGLSDRPDVVIQPGQTVGLVSANTARAGVIVQAEATELCMLRIGGATVGPTAGVKLPCGGGLLGAQQFAVTGALRCHNAGSVAVTVSVNEVIE